MQHDPRVCDLSRHILAQPPHPRALPLLTEAGRLAGHVALVVVRVDVDVRQELEQHRLGRVHHPGGHRRRDAGRVRHAADPLHLTGVQPLPVVRGMGERVESFVTEVSFRILASLHSQPRHPNRSSVTS